MKSPDDLIEQYLDELVAELTPLGPRRLRQVLAETEAHLWDAVAVAVEAGMNERDAQGQAIARFGPADALVAAEYRRTSRSALTVLRQAVSSLWLLGAIVAVEPPFNGATTDSNDSSAQLRVQQRLADERRRVHATLVVVPAVDRGHVVHQVG